MPQKIKINFGELSLSAQLNDSETARAVRAALPLQAAANTWGEEIYFTIPLKCTEENPQEIVNLGDLAYWPPGRAFCIFFGATPASQGEEIRPASPVNIIGRVTGNLKELRSIKEGTLIIIEEEK